MNLNYSIFRSKPIMTTQDLAQIGSYNKRKKKAYNSNPDIKIALSKNNIKLVSLAEKYLKGFDELTKDHSNNNKNIKTKNKKNKSLFAQCAYFFESK